MPLTALLAPIADAIFGFLVSTVTSTVKSAAEGKRWAKDRQRLARVQSLAIDAVNSATKLVRNIPTESATPLLTKNLADFKKQIQEAGVPEEDADELCDSVESQIQSALQSIREMDVLRTSIGEIDAEMTQLTTRVAVLEKLSEDAKREQTTLQSLRTVASLALAMAAVAILISLAIIVVKLK